MEVAMKKKRFTEAQIAFALRFAESGTAVEQIIRKMGISEATFYRWKKKYAGLGVAEMRRLKQLEDENKQLKPQERGQRKLSVKNFAYLKARMEDNLSPRPARLAKCPQR